MTAMTFKFRIEDTGSSRIAIGDRLILTKDGAIKIKLGSTLVGIIKADSWRRVVLDQIDSVEESLTDFAKRTA